MMTTRILSIANPTDLDLLRKESLAVSFITLDDGTQQLDQETTELVEQLKQIVISRDGLGISAVQVGVHKKLFLLRTKQDKLLTIINPRIIKGKGSNTGPEGCFSIDLSERMAAMVKRMTSINVVYDNEHGKLICSELLGLDAIVFQHEYDHCLGKLMIDPPHFTGWSKF